MKKYLYFIIVAFTLSCESNVDEKSNNIASKIIELTEEEFISIAYDDNVELLENHIIDIVQDFVASENLPENRIAHTRSTDLSITIKEKNYLKFKSMNTRTIANTDNSIEVPIFNVSVRTEKSNNIALVSGDERLPVIIAYYNDEFTDSCNLDNNILLNYSQQMLYRDLCYMENVRDSLHNPTIFKISQILNIPTDEIKFENIKSQIVIKEVGTNTRAAMIVDPVGSGSLLASFGPLCRVKWNVGMPYNRTMPQTCPNNWLWDNRYAISSVVLATAQAMSFYKPSMFVYGQSINWDYLRENEEIHEYTDYFGEYVADPIERRNMVANLLKYIGEQCSVSYTCSGSSVNFSNVINFINRYGLTIDGRQDIDVEKLVSSLKNLNPVIVYGQTSAGAGHWWLVDGYLTVRGPEGTTRSPSYVHANMGMGKSYCGYYYASYNRRPTKMTFDPGFANFDSNIVMYTNMRRIN